MRREIDNILNRAKIYSEEKTFTFVKEVINGRGNFYNGFVVRVHTDMIIFFDIILKKEFPILVDYIDVIEPSKKDVEIKTALEIYENEQKRMA